MHKIMILGHKRHGKDTVAEYLNLRYGIRYESSSRLACQIFLYDQLKDKYGYKTVDQCYEDRVNHRKEWYEAIVQYNTPRKTRLMSDIYKYNQIYCGIRDKVEFLQGKKEGLFDLSIFIDAGDRLPLEDSESMKLSKADADIVIDNNHNLLALYDHIDRLFTALGYKPIN